MKSAKAKIIELIQRRRDAAAKDLEENERIAGQSAYGTGVSWGEVMMCDVLLEDIESEV